MPKSILVIMDEVIEYINISRRYINETCSHLEAVEIIIGSFLATLGIIWIKSFFHTDADSIGLKQSVLRRLRRLPIVRQVVEKKMEAVTCEVEEKLSEGLRNKTFLKQLPKHGWSQDDILKEVDAYLEYKSFNWEDGRVSGAVYHGNNPELKDLMGQVYKKTAYENPLHPDICSGVRLMESEIIRIACSLFKGDRNSCGTVTTGGTESIFLACKAYRDYAKSEKGIKEPNMVIPVTAHAAFGKSANILKIQVRLIAMDPHTTRVNVRAMKKAIDKNTCMLVGSAPAFPHGSIDPIEEISKLGYSYNIPVHVDACLGGFLIPFMEKAGFKIPPFDFTLDGVTSISADTHKYAFAPKGSSVIMYRNKTYRHHQYFIQPDWPGGIYGTPSISGSRAGGAIATCWASLLYHGEDFYVEATRKIISVTRYIVKGIQEIPGIFIYGQPDVSVVAIGSKDFDVYRLSHALMKKGWCLNSLQFPPGFHFCVTLQHTQEGVADAFLANVQECTKEILKMPKTAAEGTAAIYGMAQQIPDRSLVSELVWAFLDACTSTEYRKQDH